MNRNGCSREAEVLDAVCTGRWPETCDAALREHVAACGPCTEVAELAAALRAERASTWQRAAVPSSGLVWWRAELRARQERAARIDRPIALVHLLAIAVCLAGAVIAAAVAVPLAPGGEWLASLAAWMPAFTIGDATANPLLQSVLLVALGLCLILAPVVVYLVVERD